MIRAYDKVYLDKARIALGRMLDYAVYDLGFSVHDFFELFIRSGVATRFENGDYALIVGKSGVELAYEVLDALSMEYERKKPNYTADRSEEYWAGWALAYYQWETAIEFSEIVKYVPIDEIVRLYLPYHEMDIRQFVDKVNDLYKRAKPDSNLKNIRQRVGISQRQLSELSGVPLRTIQQYEQRQKNINKAQVEYLISLSQVLCCDVKDLTETVVDVDEK